MQEIILVVAAGVLGHLIAFVADEGIKPMWLVEKQKAEAKMSEIAERQPGGLLSDFEARW